jgi:hypothetical protein
MIVLITEVHNGGGGGGGGGGGLQENYLKNGRY